MAAELVDLHQHRSRQRFHLPDQGRNVADLGVGSSRHHDPGGLPGGDKRSRVKHAKTVAERCVGGDRILRLVHRQRFARQDRFVHQQVTRLRQAQICGGLVARLHDHDIAGHNLTGVDLVACAATQNRGMWRDHVADRVERGFRLAFLHEAYNRVDQDDREDDRHIDVMTQEARRSRSGQQEIDQQIVELRQKTQHRVRARRRGQFIRAIRRQPARGFCRLKSVGACAQCRKNVGQDKRVPVVGSAWAGGIRCQRGIRAIVHRIKFITRNTGNGCRHEAHRQRC